MSDLTNAITSINNAADRAENTSDFLDNWSTYDENSYVTNPNNNETVASAAKLVKDRTDELFPEVETELNEILAEVQAAADKVEDAEEATEAANTAADAANTAASNAEDVVEVAELQLEAQQTEFEAQLSSALATAGYTVVGNFTDGVSVTSRSEAVYLSGDYEGFYIWTGTFPKTVSAGDSPFDEDGWMLAATGYVKQSSVVQLFGQTIDADLSIPVGQNALSINPTVSDGATVTVPSGSQYVILGSTS